MTPDRHRTPDNQQPYLGRTYIQIDLGLDILYDTIYACTRCNALLWHNLCSRCVYNGVTIIAQLQIRSLPELQKR